MVEARSAVQTLENPMPRSRAPLTTTEGVPASGLAATPTFERTSDLADVLDTALRSLRPAARSAQGVLDPRIPVASSLLADADRLLAGVRDVLRGGAWVAPVLGERDPHSLACAIDALSGEQQQRAACAELGALLAMQLGAPEGAHPTRLARRVLREADPDDVYFANAG
jgi:hypothetical protein